MFLRQFDMEVETGQEWHFYLTADTHLGSEQFHRPSFVHMRNKITRDPMAIWGFLGDLTDDARPTTRARLKATLSDRPEVLKQHEIEHLSWLQEKVVPLFMPLTEKRCIGGVAGHHYRMIGNQTNTQRLFKMLSDKGKYPVPYLGEQVAWVRLNLKIKGKNSHGVIRHILLQHGSGGGMAAGSALRKLQESQRAFHADVYCRAHSHGLESKKHAILTPRLNRGGEQSFDAKPIVHIQTGSCLRGYAETKGPPPYSEMYLMPPSSIGWARLDMEIRKAGKWEDPNENITVEFFARI